MKYIPTAVTKQVFRSALILKKNSPNLMFVTGIGGVVASTVLACRATLKLSDDLPEMKADIVAVKERDVPEDTTSAAVALMYGMNVGHVAKLYAPSVLVGAASIGLLTGSHVQLTRRNAGLTAAYAAVSKAYDEYRLRAQIELGPEKELDLYHNARVETIENVEGLVDDIKVASRINGSPYARFFDECSREWQKNAELNRMFVACQQQYANDLLNSRGHLFLNEVYDMLGFDRTTIGALVGWVSDGEGDGFVDFGVFEAVNNEFVNGWERTALLDFNVDGVVYNLIEK